MADVPTERIARVRAIAGELSELLQNMRGYGRTQSPDSTSSEAGLEAISEADRQQLTTLLSELRTTVARLEAEAQLLESNRQAEA